MRELFKGLQVVLLCYGRLQRSISVQVLAHRKFHARASKATSAKTTSPATPTHLAATAQPSRCRHSSRWYVNCPHSSTCTRSTCHGEDRTVLTHHQIVIDGKGHLLGRLASTVAKQLLEGQKLVVVRCEALNISGEFFRAKRASSCTRIQTPPPPH